MKVILLCTIAIILTAGSCKKSAEKQLPPAHKPVLTPLDAT